MGGTCSAEISFRRFYRSQREASTPPTAETRGDTARPTSFSFSLSISFSGRKIREARRPPRLSEQRRNDRLLQPSRLSQVSQRKRGFVLRRRNFRPFFGEPLQLRRLDESDGDLMLNLILDGQGFGILGEFGRQDQKRRDRFVRISQVSVELLQVMLQGAGRFFRLVVPEDLPFLAAERRIRLRSKGSPKVMPGRSS